MRLLIATWEKLPLFSFCAAVQGTRGLMEEEPTLSWPPSLKEEGTASPEALGLA